MRPSPREQGPRARSALLTGLIAAAVAVVVAALLAFAGALDEDGERPPAGAVAQGGAEAGGAFERVRPGLVAVTAAGRGGGAGSGFLVDEAGHVVTTSAVLGRRREARVYAEGRAGPIAARVVGRDAATTLVVLRIARDDARSIEPLELQDPLRVRPGEAVLAAAAPFLVEGATRAGVVSAVDRSVRARGGVVVHGAIETDATTDGRNAGGPLIDADGGVIGVLLAPARPRAGTGYAAPADVAREVVAALEGRGSLRAASAGMRTETVDPGVAQLLGLPVEHGLLVRAVEPGGPADRAGVRPAPRGDPLAGDVVVAVAGREVRRPGDVGRLLAAASRRAGVPLVVVRDRQRLVLRLMPGSGG